MIIARYACSTPIHRIWVVCSSRLSHLSLSIYRCFDITENRRVGFADGNQVTPDVYDFLALAGIIAGALSLLVLCFVTLQWTRNRQHDEPAYIMYTGEGFPQPMLDPGLVEAHAEDPNAVHQQQTQYGESDRP